MTKAGFDTLPFEYLFKQSSGLINMPHKKYLGDDRLLEFTPS